VIDCSKASVVALKRSMRSSSLLVRMTVDPSGLIEIPRGFCMLPLPPPNRPVAIGVPVHPMNRSIRWLNMSLT